MNTQNESAPAWQGRGTGNRTALITLRHPNCRHYGLQSITQILQRLFPRIPAEIAATPERGCS